MGLFGFGMVVYSHSRISRFENCPYSYKLKYIDRVKVDVKSVEILLGRLVHEVLEKLYKDKKFMKDVSKEDLLLFFNELWEKNYSDDIVIVKKDLGAENYRKMGEKFIGDYYDSHAPFDDLTILGLETNDRISLPDGNQWYVMIDKLACDGEGNYYVMDYKTSNRMMTQDDADSDRQLALYSVWVKKKFGDVKSVKLVWHMLAFDKDVVSERTDAEVEDLQREICLNVFTSTMPLKWRSPVMPVSFRSFFFAVSNMLSPFRILAPIGMIVFRNGRFVLFWTTNFPSRNGRRKTSWIGCLSWPLSSR